MAAQIQDRRLSPVELLESHLRQIERWNPRLNAITVPDFDRARDAARRAEEQMRVSNSAAAGASGSLYGIPLTVKDCFDVAGLPTRIGSRVLPDTPAAEDSALVARLRAAGAIILGKTNTPEFMVNYETDNLLHGRTNNPWDLERTPGGSSGGEAAAIASLCSAGGIGSDGGGSIRIPAHFTGICGLKPTPGRLSTTGERNPPLMPAGIGVPGPLARTVADVRTLFRVLAGYDAADPLSAPVTPRPLNVQGARIGVMESFLGVPVCDAVREAIRKAARDLATAGFAVEEVRLEGLERAPNVWSFLFNQVPAPARRDLIGAAEASWTATEGLEKLCAMPQPSALEYLAQIEERDRLRRSAIAQMRDYAAVLLPVSSIVAFPHRERRFPVGEKPMGLFQAMIAATWLNVLGLPGLVLPYGQDAAGIPVGVQLAGKPWEEEVLLEIGVRLENARGPFPSPPGCLS